MKRCESCSDKYYNLAVSRVRRTDMGFKPKVTINGKVYSFENVWNCYYGWKEAYLLDENGKKVYELEVSEEDTKSIYEQVMSQYKKYKGILVKK